MVEGRADLGGTVGRAAGKALLAIHRGHVDNAALAILPQERDAMLRQGA